MKSINSTALTFLFLIILSSCQQRLYFPDRANTPGLTHAMEGKLTFSIKPQANDHDTVHTQDVSLGSGIDLAFSPVKNLGLIASYRRINNRRIKEDQDVPGGNTVGGLFNGERWEVGAGYYDVFGKIGKVEVYGGYGNGSLQRRGTLMPQYNYDTRYHRFFIQPAMGFSKSDFFSFTAGLRFAFMKFYNFRSGDPDLKYYIGRSDQDVTTALFPFIEPFVNVEGGYKFIKANVQVGATAQILQTNISGNFPVYCSVGLIFHFSPEYFKK